MSELGPWLDDRHPQPPRALRSAIDEALERAGSSGAGPEPARPAGALADAGYECLGAAVRRPGRVRAAAFELLTADALLTYACEAALESADPATALERLCAGPEVQAP